MPPDIKDLAEQAQMLYDKGDYSATLPLFEEICRIAPASPARHAEGWRPAS